MTDPSTSIVPRLADCIVRDENEREVRVGDLWKERTVVLCFVRHFG